SDDCLGNRCEFYEQSPHRVARSEAAHAHMIIANHALYFADLASGGGILPAHKAVIFDEAHHVPAAATRAFTGSVGRYSITKLMQKIRKRIGMVPDDVVFNLVGLESRLM